MQGSRGNIKILNLANFDYVLGIVCCVDRNYICCDFAKPTFLVTLPTLPELNTSSLNSCSPIPCRHWPVDFCLKGAGVDGMELQTAESSSLGEGCSLLSWTLFSFLWRSQLPAASTSLPPSSVPAVCSQEKPIEGLCLAFLSHESICRPVT